MGAELEGVGLEDWGWETGVALFLGGGEGFGAAVEVSPTFLFTQRFRSGS